MRYYPKDEPRRRFLISTGEGIDRKFYDDLWSFDFALEEWTELRVDGDVGPEERYGATGSRRCVGTAHIEREWRHCWMMMYRIAARHTHRMACAEPFQTKHTHQA